MRRRAASLDQSGYLSLTELPAIEPTFTGANGDEAIRSLTTDHTLVDGVTGQGHYVGTYLAWGVRNNGWWGEGEIKFFMDGDKDWPTICVREPKITSAALGILNFQRAVWRLHVALLRVGSGDQA